jgi:GNAT superfamily N-acetyltransferase
MAVIEVGNRKQLRDFVFFPRSLYRFDPYWVPPIWFEEKSAYSRKKNPILANSDFALALALHEKKIVGRNLVYIDHTFNDFTRTEIGFFGAFECIKDEAPARELLEFAENWLRQHGMKAIRGPIHPVAENWGFLHQGFEATPVYLSPYNPSYYSELIIRSGYEKAKDLLVFEADVKKGYEIPPRFIRFYDRFTKRHPEISIRKLNLKNLDEEAEQIWKLSNLAYRHNWGYVPLDVHVLRDMIRKLKMIVDTDAVWMAEHNGEIVAYCLGFPDLNVILKKIRGRLFPFGFIRILKDIKKVRDYRLFGLAIHPRYQNLGLDAVLYVHLARALSPKQVRLEANYILEDNHKIRNALEKLSLKHTKTYRIYEKKL